MVGLGTQDNLEEAEEFVARFGITFTMLWDPTFESWANLGVSLQPSALLLASDGRMLGRWLGPIPEDDVVELARGAAPIGEVAGNSPRFCRYVDRYVQAERELDSVDTRRVEDRPIVYDDIRYAANAMAQTAPTELVESIRDFAAAVQDLAGAAVASDYDLDAARRSGDYDALDARRTQATAAVADRVNELCDTGFGG